MRKEQEICRIAISELAMGIIRPDWFVAGKCLGKRRTGNISRMYFHTDCLFLIICKASIRHLEVAVSITQAMRLF